MDAFFEAIEEGIIKYWAYILAAIIICLIFAYHLQYSVIGFLIPLLCVIILGRIAWIMWVHYVRQDFISGIDFVLLEIIPPRDVLRSPKAMELFFTNALYQWSMKGTKESYWQGAVWFWFSLEIASIDGQVHFYIRTPTRVRGLIETQMYAQYPQAQVKEVEDYTLAVDEITPKSAWMAWGCEFKLLKHEAYPIKTYEDFGLDKDPKEEYKVDPISPVIELFGSIQKGEQMWMQIVVTPSKKTYHKEDTWFGKNDWVAESLRELINLQSPYISTRQSAPDPKYGVTKFGVEVRTPEHLKDIVKRMNDKRSKLGFDTGIRVMYIAKKEAYDMRSRRNIRLIFRQYGSPEKNEFYRINSAQADAFNTQVFSLPPEKVMLLADRMLHAYREREFFHLPMRHHLFNEHNFNGIFLFIFKQFFMPYFHPAIFVLNTEELATIWHFPGQIMRVPTLERIESKEASPPPNLPT